jgi:hypothetical protein
MLTKPSVMMAFACERVSAEPGTPTTFHNMLDGIEAPDFPAPTAQFVGVFAFYSSDPMTIKNCRVIVEHEGGEMVAQTKVRDLNFAQNTPISRNVVGFHGFAWPYPGWYRVKFVADKDTVLATFPLLVQHAAEQPTKEQ